MVKTKDQPDLPPLFRRSAEASARWLEEHGNDPLPDPELGPNPAWPSWARFEISFDETMLDEFADDPDHYASARQVAALLEPLLEARLEQHPDEGPRIDRIRAQMRYWVRHDDLCPPGEGNTTEIDGYRWDPDRLDP